MSKKAEENYRIGRLYYLALTDAQGYPNGMPYWDTMSPQDKYYYTVTAIDFLEHLMRERIITPYKEFGLDNSVYGEGECKELMDLIVSKAVEERENFDKKVKLVTTFMKENFNGTD